MDELTEDERAIVHLVREFVDRDVKPVARDLEHANTYPEKLIEQMKQLGIFGLAIPEPWGEARVSTPCYALVTEELARGWMSLAGAMGGHTVVAKLLVDFGTDEQKDSATCRGWPPGEIRATMALTEPGGGSDLQAMRTTARRDGDGLRRQRVEDVDQQRAALAADRADVQDRPGRRPGARRASASCWPSTGPGFTVSRDLPKLGYKGVESCELAFDDFRVPATALLGGTEGKGFAQMMRGLEIGRIQVAARAVGVARAALEDALRYAQQRETFGKPIWQHQSIGNYLADMATKLTAARQLVLYAARRYDPGAARRHGGGHGQAVRLGDGDADRAGRGAHPRRLRLLDRVRRGALLPRRAADDRRRGHQRDPAQRHRPPAHQAQLGGPVTSPRTPS